MKNILTEALVNSATNASFIFSYTNSAKLRFKTGFTDGFETFSIILFLLLYHQCGYVIF